MIRFYCTSVRVDCTVINDGKEGLEIIRKTNDFDLVSLDVGMPDFSGIDIVNSLRQDGVESKNVVIVTASSDKKYRMI